MNASRWPYGTPATLAPVKPVVVDEAQASLEELDGASGASCRNPLRSVKNDFNSEAKSDESSGHTDRVPVPPTDGPGRRPGRPQLKRVK